MYRFLEEFEEQAKRMVVFPKSFTERPSRKASQARFQDAGGKRRLRDRIREFLDGMKTWLRRFPSLYSVLRCLKQQIERPKKLAKKLAVLPQWDWLKGRSGVETVLIRYGLITHAELLRRNRPWQLKRIQERSR